MTIIINNSSQAPIYEQIIKQIKVMITSGRLKSGDPLPSVRGLARELGISALTVKKAYDALEQEGLTVTVHGKGSFVTGDGLNLLGEQAMREVETVMERAVAMGRALSMTDEQLMDILRLILEEEKC